MEGIEGLVEEKVAEESSDGEEGVVERRSDSGVTSKLGTLVVEIIGKLAEVVVAWGEMMDERDEGVVVEAEVEMEEVYEEVGWMSRFSREGIVTATGELVVVIGIVSISFSVVTIKVGEASTRFSEIGISMEVGSEVSIGLRVFGKEIEDLATG